MPIIQFKFKEKLKAIKMVQLPVTDEKTGEKFIWQISETRYKMLMDSIQNNCSFNSQEKS